MFKYKIENNFFEEKDFLKLKSIANDKNNLNELKDDNYIAIHLESDFEKYLIEKYQHKLFKYLDELNPKKRNLVDYTHIRIGICGKNYKYPIHTDSLRKVITAVIYLSPENNVGTFIYDRKKQNPYEIEWKMNKAFIFSRKEKNSHHSFHADGNNYRCVVNFNLETKKINRVEIFDRGFIRFSLNKMKSLINKINS